MRNDTDDKISTQDHEQPSIPHVFQVTEESMSTMKIQTDVKI